MAAAQPRRIKDYRWIANQDAAGFLIYDDPASGERRLEGNAFGSVTARSFQDVPTKTKDGHDGLFIPSNLNSVSLYIQVPAMEPPEASEKIGSILRALKDSPFPALWTDPSQDERLHVADLDPPPRSSDWSGISWYIPAETFRELYGPIPLQLELQDRARGSKDVMKRGRLSAKENNEMLAKIFKAVRETPVPLQKFREPFLDLA